MREEIINCIRELKEATDSGIKELGEQINANKIPLELHFSVLDNFKNLNSNSLNNLPTEFDENFAKLLVDPEALIALK